VKVPQLGFHVSISGSIDKSVDRALEAGCTTFQIFTRNPRGWNFKDIDESEASAFVEKREKAGFKKVIVHMPYLPNLAASDKTFVKKSRASLKEEVSRGGKLGIDYVVAHIGSHMGKGSMAGVKNVIDACNEALDSNPNGTSLLVENMAGQKNCVGASFEELKLILDGVNQKDRIGVCFDTCHAFAAGFDISNKNGVEATLELLDSTLGLKNIKVVHLNDSKGPLGGKLDRHEHVGMGRIGEAGFRALLSERYISGLPLLMEVPQDERRSDADELIFVKGLVLN
jgi:deoxyribonuclease-4